MNNHDAIYKIYTDAVDSDGLDDLHEYDKQALMDRFELSNDEATLLYLMVQGATNLDYSYMHTDATRFDETIQEALHQNLDGWTDSDKAVIIAFLADVSFASRQGD